MISNAQTHPSFNPPVQAPLPDSDSLIGQSGLIRGADAEALETSFGVFNPVGHVMTGAQTQDQIDALIQALHRAGWSPSALRQFSPHESRAEFQAMVDKAGPLAGFGYEITLLRRYLAMTEEGYRWLLVKAKNIEHAAEAAKVAGACGASLAIYYRLFTVEELVL
ncbi:hypothetical protein [Paucibacter sp. Y2R2-4]|uniref:hypothetical protein n=1 Tax=Paucibacter sp. Y2R2-4 TaxID=2893553 RepID=UPI0021E4498A|nr:hypothetical protein [Paucibacter sp. Y2R2-4]MCV2352028.1 hypothetical protein [Paucibacter sp. Y2R2-4]